MNASQIAYKARMKESKEWGQHRGNRTEQSARYITKYPERCRANGRVQYALQTGKLRKPEHCEICLRKAELHGHHEDYDKPLEVVWVCSWCHNVIHADKEGDE